MPKHRCGVVDLKKKKLNLVLNLVLVFTCIITAVRVLNLVQLYLDPCGTKFKFSTSRYFKVPTKLILVLRHVDLVVR